MACCGAFSPLPLKCRKPRDLAKLYKKFPHAASLKLEAVSWNTEDLLPLSAYTQLTELFLKHVLEPSGDAEGPFEPDFLPQNIMSLSLEDLRIRGKRSYTSLTNATKLSSASGEGSRVAASHDIKQPSLSTLPSRLYSKKPEIGRGYTWNVDKFAG